MNSSMIFQSAISNTVRLAALLFLFTSPQQLNADFLHTCKEGTGEEVSAALKEGADPNAKDSDGVTALMFAAAYNPNPEVITALAKAGADLNATGPHGVSILMIAAKNNPTREVIVTLVKAGADPNVMDSNGDTALTYAAMGNPNPEVIMFRVTLQPG